MSPWSAPPAEWIGPIGATESGAPAVPDWIGPVFPLGLGSTSEDFAEDAKGTPLRRTTVARTAASAGRNPPNLLWAPRMRALREAEGPVCEAAGPPPHTNGRMVKSC